MFLSDKEKKRSMFSRRVWRFFVLFVFILIVFFNFYLNELFKTFLEDELAKLTGYDVKVKRAYISAFNLEAGLSGFLVKNRKGMKVVALDSLHVSLSFWPLLLQKIVIKDITVKSPYFYADKNLIDTLLQAQSNPLPIDLRKGLLTNGQFSVLYGDDTFHLTVDHFKGRVVDMFSDITVSSEGLVFQRGNKSKVFMKIPVDILSARVKKQKDGKNYELKHLIYRSDGLKVDATGKFNGKLQGTFSPLVEVKMDYLKTLFSLKNKGDGKIVIDGTFNIKEKNVLADLLVKGDFYVETILEMAGVNKPIAGYVSSLKGKVFGAVRSPRAKADLTCKDGNIFGVLFDTLDTSVRYEEGKLHFPDGRAVLYDGSANASAILNMPVVDYYELYVDAYSVQSDSVFNLIKWNPNISKGRISGSLVTKGKKFNPLIEFSYVKSPPGKSKEKKTQTENVLKRVAYGAGNVYFKDKVLTIKDVEVKTEDTVLKAKGSIDFKKDKLNLSTNLNTMDVADLSRPYSEDFRGQGNLTATLVGKIKKPHLKGVLTLKDGKIYNLEFEDLKANVDYTVDTLTLKTVSGHAYGGSARVSLNMGFKKPEKLFHFNNPSMDLSADFKGLKVDGFARSFGLKNVFKGRFDATGFKLSGKNLKDLSSEGKISAKGFSVYGVDLGSIRARFEMESGKLKIPVFETKKGASKISLTMNSENKLGSYVIKSKYCQVLIKYTPLKDYVSGKFVKCNISGKGSFNDLDLDFTLNAKKLKTDSGIYIGDIKVSGKVREKNTTIIANAFNDRVKAVGQVNFLNSKSMPWDLDVKIKKGHYGFLAKRFFKNAPENMKLKVGGEIGLKGNRNNIKGKAVFKDLDIYAYDIHLKNSHNITINIDDKKVVIDPVTLKDRSNKITVDGVMQIGKSIDLNVEGGLSLKTFKLFSDKITLLDGAGDLLLKVVGNWGSPSVYGDLEISNGSLGIKNFDYFFNNINGYAFFDMNKIVLSDLSSSMGGGSISAKGTAYLENRKLKQFFLESNLHGLPLKVIDGLKLRLGGNLNYKGNMKKQFLVGSIDIEKAVYDKDFHVMDLIFGKKKPVRNAGYGVFGNTRLNVALSGDKNIIIKNNIARSNVALDLNIRGSVLNPVVYGRVDTSNGKVFLNNTEFKITKASVLFTGQMDFNPYINVLALTTESEYTISLIVDGRLDSLNLTMASNPPLKEDEILALLSKGSGASSATAFLTSKYERMITDRIKDITGLDEINITTMSTEDEDGSSSAIAPRVTMKKEVIPDKLILTLITSGTSDGDYVRVEYLINKNLSIQAVGDKKRGVGGDVKLRFEFD